MKIMPGYDWVCHACKSTNRSGTEVCSLCGFRAVSSGAEVKKFIAGNQAEMDQAEPFPTRRQLKELLQKEFSDLPLWKKTIVLTLRSLQFFGGLMCWLTLSFSGIVSGVAIIVSAEFLYWVLVSRRSRWRQPVGWADERSPTSQRRGMNRCVTGGPMRREERISSR